jgi:hypothetical protein
LQEVARLIVTSTGEIVVDDQAKLTDTSAFVEDSPGGANADAHPTDAEQALVGVFGTPPKHLSDRANSK